MSGITKYAPINNNGGSNSMISDFKTTSQFFAIFTTKKTASFVYCFIFICSIFTIFLAFSTSTSNSSVSSSSSFSISSDEFYRSQVSSIYYYFFSNSTSNVSSGDYKNGVLSPSFENSTATSKPSSDLSKGSSSVKKQSTDGVKHENFTVAGVGKVNEEKGVVKNGAFSSEQSTIGVKNENYTKVNEENGSKLKTIGVKNKNFTANEDKKASEEKGTKLDKIGIKSKNLTAGEDKKVIEEKGLVKNATFTQEQTTIGVKSKNLTANEDKLVIKEKGLVKNATFTQEQSTIGVKSKNLTANEDKKVIEEKGLMNCDLFDGNWVKDETYPLYKPGSCSLIDEQFNCFLNGRPDNDYYKLKWKPKGCTLPRLNGSHMLELLRGKRLVFVGDSLNRNMWESLVCILKNSLKDPKKAYEESGRNNYRTEPSYSFVFEDYKATVEFFVSPFLVQESEAADKNGTKKETLRLDIVESFADKYRKADVIVFNTGHWWTHEKTSKGKDYYQEGSHVYSELNVEEAFRKALTTWGIWVDKNVNPKKSLVFFRGYSASHFSGGQWNSGGQCDNETEPIKNDTYLTPYPLKMTILEKVLKGMRTNVGYLNVTKMTDYRKDGHPSIYRKLHLSDEEAKAPLQFQDCSHWCLPGVPDAWNEVLYAQLLVKLNKL